MFGWILEGGELAELGQGLSYFLRVETQRLVSFPSGVTSCSNSTRVLPLSSRVVADGVGGLFAGVGDDVLVEDEGVAVVGDAGVEGVRAVLDDQWFGGVDDEIYGVGVDFAVGGCVGAPSVPVGSVVADDDLGGDGWVGFAFEGAAVEVEGPGSGEGWDGFGLGWVRVVSARRQRARYFMAEVYLNMQRKLEVGEGKVDVEDDGADGAVWDG